MDGGAGPYGFLGDQLTTVEKAEALKRVPLFGELSQDYLNAVARHGLEIRAEGGDVLVREGDTGRDLILILEGAVRVDRGGKTMARLSQGDFFGELALLDGKPRSATVVADAPCRLIVVDSLSFGQLLESQPGLTRRLLVTLANRLRGESELA